MPRRSARIPPRLRAPLFASPPSRPGRRPVRRPALAGATAGGRSVPELQQATLSRSCGSPLSQRPRRLAARAPARCRWRVERPAGQRAGAGGLGGKDERGAAQQPAAGRRMMVAAVEHGTGLGLGQGEGGRKSNTSPAGRELSRTFALCRTRRALRCAACPPLHGTMPERGQRRLRDHRLQGQQETLRNTLQALAFSQAPSHAPFDQGHGHFAGRRCAVGDLSGDPWHGKAAIQGRRQAVRLERERDLRKIAPKRPGAAFPRRPPRRARASAGSGAHSLAERECRNLPHNFTCLPNAARVMGRWDGRFRPLLEAPRHDAARVQEVRATLTALTRTLNRRCRPPASGEGGRCTVQRSIVPGHPESLAGSACTPPEEARQPAMTADSAPASRHCGAAPRDSGPAFEKRMFLHSPALDTGVVQVQIHVRL